MAAPRDDGALLCQRIGCDARYREDSNAEGSCRHHPGPPVFHDGGKEWSCCKQRSHDFALFMSIPGCAYAKHTQEKPPKPPAPAPRGPAPMPLPLGGAARAGGADGRATCIRCRQGFFCSDHPAEPPAAAVEPPKPPPPKPPADPDALQTCRNKGCGSKFTERANADDACRFHPGPPIFHERQKGWQCCNKVVYDFDEFMNIPPCTSGRHNADADGGGYAKLAK